MSSVDATRIVLRPLGNPLPLGLLALAAATLLVSGLQLGWLAPSDGRAVAPIRIAFVFALQLLASIFGFLCRDVVVLAIYAALAMAFEDATHRTSLPLGRRRTGRDALADDLGEQLASVEHEAGVRQQL